ncbi:MAG TPA: holo-[acyl-carrier-protein] synthase [Elusimicrobia bacterium]|nr:holo-[acyl-carrier-protein] synthase [Elusimicrobiota bacterium]HBT60995.1 holo-[acyl-carrier-protein] synthase [Elusimicrobiota bacterium]
MDIGLDIVEVKRIRKIIRRTPGFLRRVFSPAELSYCRAKKDPWPHFAVRFAAKEAVWKSLGQDGVALRDISVVRERTGKPGVLIKGRRVRGLRISLSHGEDYAVAVALREGKP